MYRRSFLAGSTVALAAPNIARAAASVLRMVPQANLTSIDPMWTTANITRNHGFMVTQVSADLFRRLGFNHDLALSDWGTVIQRRSSREPVEKAAGRHYARRSPVSILPIPRCTRYCVETALAAGSAGH